MEDNQVLNDDNQSYDKVLSRSIKTEMESSFLDYAMSVIVSRALPDVRDGLKPVHRRIIYAMNDIGLHADKQYRKSATVVGEVLGKYHPHGDSSVYDAMVRMAQDFSTRYPLVDGHGNFGSLDGDEPAAMRYTEAKMSKIAMMLVENLKEDTIDWTDNFDAREKEPSVLPSRYPNLLANGASGIAVGMATNIPPHNLGELIDGVVALIKNPDITIKELNEEYIFGPDFPTGAYILGRSGIRSAFETGKGSIIMRAVSHIEQTKSGKNQIVVTEIPYQVNKANLILKIAEIVKDKKVEGITEIRDTSNRKGISIIIDLKKDANPEVVLNRLYKLTPLQSNFAVNSLSLVNGSPELLNLKQMLVYYLDHQREVIYRRTKFRYQQAYDRAHILEGLQIALDNIDRVIEIIRSSSNDPEAIQSLMSEFGLSEIQSKAIMDMRLGRLTGLAREKLDAELSTLHETMEYLQNILDNSYRVDEIIEEELLEIKAKFADKRRSEIITGDFDIEDEDLIPEESVVVTITKNGYIKRLPLDTYSVQNRGTQGKRGMSIHEDDEVEQLLTMSSHDYLLAFSNKGKVYRLKGYQVPEASRTGKGLPVINLLQIDGDEKILSLKTISEYSDDHYMAIVTKKGLVKRTPLSEFASINRNGKIAITLNEGDEFYKAIETNGKADLLIASSDGFVVKFNEEYVEVKYEGEDGTEKTKFVGLRPSGRTSMGSKGINLNPGAEVVGFASSLEGDLVFSITANGKGKVTSIDKYPLRARGGKGVKNIKITDKNGQLILVRCLNLDDDILISTTNGMVNRVSVSALNPLGRNTQGVNIINVKDDMVSSVSVVEKDLQGNDEDFSEEIVDLQDDSTIEDSTVETSEEESTSLDKEDLN